MVGNDFCDVVTDFFASRELIKQVNHSIIALIPKLANVTFVANFHLSLDVMSYIKSSSRS
jgi:hypothetical protein